MAAETLTADRQASISDHPQERDVVQGNRGSMRIKFFEEVGLVGFDAAALKGKSITGATLCVKPAGGEQFNLNGGTDLTWISVSSVSQAWDVGKVWANRCDVRDDWGWAGARVYDVVLGSGNTLRCNGRLNPAGGVHRMKLDPALVQALVAGASQGLFIADGSTSFSMNCLIQGDVTIEVETAGADMQAPAAPAEVTAAPAADFATAEYGAVLVSLKAPKDAFSYDITVNGEALPRWQIPFAVPGAVQAFPIVDLPPTADIRLEVTAVDGAGNRSPPVAVACKSGPTITVPRLPETKFQPAAGEPKAFGAARVYAFPAVSEIDAVTGQVLYEDEKDFSRRIRCGTAPPAPCAWPWHVARSPASRWRSRARSKA